MTRLRALTAAVALVAVAASGAAQAATGRDGRSGGSFTQHRFSSPFGARTYWVYVPSRPARAPRPLVVFLHGCNETAAQTAAASHFNQLAERRGFVVVYPQQNVTTGSSAPAADGNGVGCWNWFLPQDQQRGSGEPAVIAGITLAVARAEHVDRRRIYVEGVSAGADMSVILATAYPDLYAAAGAIAGCAYATCSDVSGLLTHQAMGSRARVVPMFIENGTADTLNNLGMATSLLSGWLGADDLADDGRLNGSISRTPASTRSYDVDQTPRPGSGDACVHNDSFTCPGGVVGFRGSYPYTVASYDDAHRCEVLQLWVVHLLEHAHPDAPGDGPYTDPLGPDITTASYDFFSRHDLTGRCTA